jgi:hypothetical protein
MTIVELRFTLDEDGKVDGDAPFMVRGADTVEFYEDEPEVMAQIADNPRRAYFEARRVNGEWKFGARVSEYDWWLQAAHRVVAH